MRVEIKGGLVATVLAAGAAAVWACGGGNNGGLVAADGGVTMDAPVLDSGGTGNDAGGIAADTGARPADGGGDAGSVADAPLDAVGDGPADGANDARDAAALRKRIFVTINQTTGNLGGLTQADAFCKTAADSAQLGGTWRAWLSDGATDAIDRITDVSPWYRLDRATVLFPTKGPLGNGIGPSAAIDPANLNTYWTATGDDGRRAGAGGNCLDWTSSSANEDAQTGDPVSQSQWTVKDLQACDTSLSLLCIEQ